MLESLSQRTPDRNVQRFRNLLLEEYFDNGFIEETLQLVTQEGSPDLPMETKDPNVVELPDGRFRMYVSWGTSDNQKWQMGLFEADTLKGPWTFTGTATINLNGDRVCAPAVLRHTLPNGSNLYIMDVQSECFDSDIPCELYRGYSSDGIHFTCGKKALINTETLREMGYEVIGVYDAGTSVIEQDGQRFEVLPFSGYRPGNRIGFGDIYMTKRKLGSETEEWEKPKRVINQDEIEFHNHPFEEGSEWGNEGAKVIQLKENVFLWIFVSFLHGHEMKQRVTWATSKSLDEKPIVLGVPYAVKADEEHGHSDSMVVGDKLVEIRQQRTGKNGGWYLVYAEHDLEKVSRYCEIVLDLARTETVLSTQQTQPLLSTSQPVVLATV